MRFLAGLIVLMAMSVPTAASGEGSKVGWQMNERIQGNARVGISPGGFAYRYDRSGVGWLGGGDGRSKWDLSCKKDAMTDTRTCLVTSFSSRLAFNVGLVDTTGIIVCVIGHDHPRRDAMIRVDQNEAFTSITGGCFIDQKLVEQLKNGRSVITRRYEWPSRTSIDANSGLDGLTDALGLAVFVYKNLESVPF